ncbi:MAG: glycerate kinase, partial [Robiginitalea sp.]|nr:glycerate kinase [Robiginitalea sp.]
DGFLDTVRAVREVETVHVEVEDPLGRDIRASYLMDAVRSEAFIEMARASGMVLLAETERDPLQTHTRGTGQLIRHAIRGGARRVYVGLGGSATNDGGCGIATVFGYRFLDRNGHELAPVGGSLEKIARIVQPEDSFLTREVEVIAVNDVSNPLWGPGGAAFVYARQKGASDAAIAVLDKGLRRLDRLVTEQLGIQAGQLAGAGAAGGTAYGLHCFLGARFISGTDYVLGLTGVEDYLSNHPVDFICTGEGRIDSQTLSGKLIQGVLALGKRLEVPVIAVCGTTEVPVEELRSHGFKAVLVVSDPQKPLSYNMEQAAPLTREAVKAYFKGFKTEGNY